MTAGLMTAGGNRRDNRRVMTNRTRSGLALAREAALGFLGMVRAAKVMVMAEKLEIEATKVKLVERKNEIVAELGDTEDILKPVELDQSRFGRISRMGEMQEHEMAMAVHRREQAELRRIEKALARIEADEYGDCVSCGEEIGPARLEVDPAVPTCIECASRAGN